MYQKVGWPYTYIFERYILKMLMAMTLPSINKQNKFAIWFFFKNIFFMLLVALKTLHILLFIILYLLNFHAKLCSTNDDDLFSIQHNSLVENELNWIILLIAIKLVLTTIKLRTFLGAFKKLTLVKRL
jgi:hypothetical protein